MRIDPKVLENSINQTKNPNDEQDVLEKSSVGNVGSGNVYINNLGQEFEKLAEEHTIAKAIKMKTHIKYKILVNQRGIAYNPDNQSYQIESERLAKHLGLQAYKFAQINEEGFTSYLKFLRTRNPTFLKEAGRGLVC